MPIFIALRAGSTSFSLISNTSPVVRLLADTLAVPENSSITLGAIYQSGTGKLYYFNSGLGNSVWDTQLDVKKDYLVLLVSATSKY